MLSIAAEYLVQYEGLKQSIETDLTITIQEIKRKYDQIYDELNKKYGRELLSPHWRSWNN